MRLQTVEYDEDDGTILLTLTGTEDDALDLDTLTGSTVCVERIHVAEDAA